MLVNQTMCVVYMDCELLYIICRCELYLFLKSELLGLHM